MKTQNYKCTKCADPVYQENEICPVCDFLEDDNEGVNSVTGKQDDKCIYCGSTNIIEN